MKRRDFRIPSEEELRRMMTPESVSFQFVAIETSCIMLGTAFVVSDTSSASRDDFSSLGLVGLILCDNARI